MKTSEAFRLTRGKLTNGVSNHLTKARFICTAADRAKVAYIVVPIISERLDGFATLESWLAIKHGVENLWNWFDNKSIRMKVQQTRINWVDSLIAEYEAKGD